MFRKPPEPENRTPRAKRYGWWRMYNGFYDHPKWKVVAKLAEVHITVVHSVAGKLQETANKGKPRGSLADFSLLETSVSLDTPLQDVERIYGVLEGLGWIDREYLVTWDDRQPDKEDPTAAERQRRSRAKKRKFFFVTRDATAASRSKRYRDGLKKKKAASSLTPDQPVTRDVTPKTRLSKKEAPVTALATGETLTWKQAQEAGYRPARQRALPLPPVPLNQRSRR
jgi:hypothetical protein